MMLNTIVNFFDLVGFFLTKKFLMQCYVGMVIVSDYTSWQTIYCMLLWDLPKSYICYIIRCDKAMIWDKHVLIDRTE
jgi:hypothetical protein